MPEHHTAAVASTSADMTEAELIAACLDGRPGAFDVIVERHRRPGLSDSATGSWATMKTRATSARRYSFVRTADSGASKANASLGTWLHRIAVNTCLNRLALKTPKERTASTNRSTWTRRASRHRAVAARRTGRSRARGGGAVAQEAAGRAHPADLPGDVPPGDCRGARHVGRCSEGKRVSRAAEPEEAAGRHRSHGSPVSGPSSTCWTAPLPSRQSRTWRRARTAGCAWRNCAPPGRAASDADMPEPSPLFWDHLSARVQDAVADEADGSPRRRGESTGRGGASGWRPSRPSRWRSRVTAVASLRPVATGRRRRVRRHRSR